MNIQINNTCVFLLAIAFLIYVRPNTVVELTKILCGGEHQALVCMIRS